MAPQLSEELKSEWRRNIPKRLNFEFDFKKSKLCHLHFEENCIVKNDYLVINGVQVKNPSRPKWKLKPKAVPTIFVNEDLPKYFNKSCNKRKSPVKRCNLGKKIPRLANAATVELSEAGNEDHLEKSITAQISKNGNLVDLPTNKWILKSEGLDSENVVAILLSEDNQCGVSIQKSVSINKTSEVKVYALGRDVTMNFNGVNVQTIEDFNNLLRNVDSAILCRGIRGFESIVCKSGQFVNNCWRHLHCEIIPKKPEKKCQNCKLLHSKLRNIQYRQRQQLTTRRTTTPRSPSNTRAYINFLRQRINNRTSQLRKTQAASSRTSIQLKHLRNSFEKKTTESLVTSIQNSPMPENMKLAMTTAVKISKLRSKKGMKYESNWLLQAMLLKIKSPRAYHYLRENDLLPLPHPSTLHNLIGALKCEFGFQDFIFNELSNDAREKKQQDLQGIVVFDEIKLRESLDFSKHDMKFHGFVDFGEYTEEYFSRRPNSEKFADHALVYMFKSLSTNRVQPIGAFASVGAAPGFILSKLLLSAILKLEAAGLQIIGNTCDGGASNKSMWTEFGISGKLVSKKKSNADSNIAFKITHPCNENRKFYFMSDVPHMIKCIRNHLLQHRVGIFDGHRISFDHYKITYERETHGGSLRLAPSITAHHIYPSPFQKMIVSYATQLFSRTMADAIEIYRSYGVSGLEDSKGTEIFTRRINDIFDFLNAGLPAKGVRKGSEAYDEISKFCSKLDDEQNTFASEKTLESLRVTLRSVVAILDEMFLLGFFYVLTVKLNQDCLERFFGILRSMGGNEDHPTVINFIQLFRLLSIYTPTKIQVKGNVKEDESRIALINYADTLRKCAKENKDVRSSRRKFVEDSILEKIIDSHNAHEQLSALLDHDYCKSEISSGIIYYLGGYVAHKAKNFTNCTNCLLSLVQETCPAIGVANITRMKSIGTLNYPTVKLFSLLHDTIEPLVQSQLSSA